MYAPDNDTSTHTHMHAHVHTHTPGFHIEFFGGGGRSLWVTAAVSYTSTQHTHISVYTN